MGTEKLWFWRRNLALALDFLPYSLLFVIVITFLFGSNRDAVRLEGFGVTTSSCRPGKLDPSVLEAGKAMMPDVVWNQAAFCEVNSFGVVPNRFVQLARVEKGADNITRSVSVNVPVDETGRASKPIYLDWVGYIGFVAAVLGFQAFSARQATPGMRLLRIRLVAEDGGPASLKRVVLRLLYATLICLTILASVFFPVWMIATRGLSAWLMLPAIFIALALHLIWWLPFELKRSLPRAPLHDIWAGTRIARVSAKPT